jgi:hypothetical protein
MHNLKQYLRDESPIGGTDLYQLKNDCINTSIELAYKQESDFLKRNLLEGTTKKFNNDNK